VAAFAVDYGVILVYLGLLTLVGVLGRAVGAVPDDVATPAGRILAQLASFLVLTVPVSAWFAGWEASRGEATPGKRMLRLRVCTTSGGRLAWPRSLLRTGLKVTLPWELAHTAVWEHARLAGAARCGRGRGPPRPGQCDHRREPGVAVRRLPAHTV
jgi:uncharacterized RDD family membrane protein YckC